MGKNDQNQWGLTGLSVTAASKKDEKKTHKHVTDKAAPTGSQPKKLAYKDPVLAEISAAQEQAEKEATEAEAKASASSREDVISACLPTADSLQGLQSLMASGLGSLRDRLAQAKSERSKVFDQEAERLKEEVESMRKAKIEARIEERRIREAVVRKIESDAKEELRLREAHWERERQREEELDAIQLAQIREKRERMMLEKATVVLEGRRCDHLDEVEHLEPGIETLAPVDAAHARATSEKLKAEGLDEIEEGLKETLTQRSLKITVEEAAVENAELQFSLECEEEEQAALEYKDPWEDGSSDSDVEPF